MLEDKTVVVTGAAGTLGLAAARALLEDGARVALVDVDAMRLDGISRFLRGATMVVACDVSDPAAVRDACAKVESSLGAVDVLVNAAAISSPPRAESTSDSEWRQVTAVNLDGAFHWTRAAIPGMKQRGWGRIVSVAPVVGDPGELQPGAAYAAARGGLVAFTRALARELAPHGVTANAVAPAHVRTPATSDALNEAQRRHLLARIPVGRFCEPEEFAHAVRFLASPLAGFVTGIVLDVNGGLRLE